MNEKPIAWNNSTGDPLPNAWNNSNKSIAPDKWGNNGSPPDSWGKGYQLSDNWGGAASGTAVIPPDVWRNNSALPDEWGKGFDPSEQWGRAVSNPKVKRPSAKAIASVTAETEKISSGAAENKRSSSGTANFGAGKLADAAKKVGGAARNAAGAAKTAAGGAMKSAAGAAKNAAGAVKNTASGAAKTAAGAAKNAAGAVKNTAGEAAKTAAGAARNAADATKNAAGSAVTYAKTAVSGVGSSISELGEKASALMSRNEENAPAENIEEYAGISVPQEAELSEDGAVSYDENYNEDISGSYEAEESYETEEADGSYESAEVIESSEDGAISYDENYDEDSGGSYESAETSEEQLDEAFDDYSSEKIYEEPQQRQNEHRAPPKPVNNANQNRRAANQWAAAYTNEAPANNAYQRSMPPQYAQTEVYENAIYQPESGMAKTNKLLLFIIVFLVLVIGILVGMFLMLGRNNKSNDDNVVSDNIVAEVTSAETTVSTENISEIATVVKETEAVVTAKEDDSINDELTKIDQSKIKEAYTRKLTEFAKTDDFNAYDYASKYALYDIDNDGIDELIIQFITTIGNAENLYCYKNGEYTEIAHCSESSFTICPEEHCVQWYGYGGGVLRSVLRLGKQGNTLDELLTETHDYTIYELNDVGISKSEYDSIMAKYDAMNWVSPSFYNFNTILSDDIIYAKPREYDQFLAVVDTESTELNVRESPSADSKILGTVPKGSYVTAAHIDGYSDWYKVEYSEKNLKGYASAQYITDSDTYKNKQQSANSNNSNIYAGYRYIENAPSDMIFYDINDTFFGIVTTESTSLNMRQGPGTNYEIILHLSKGDSVEILGMNSEWAYVKWSVWGAQQTIDYYGYVSREFLSF